PDDVLARLPKNGGVVMVTFVPDFIDDAVRREAKARTDERERLKALYGADDPRVEAELLDRGWSRDDLSKLVGGNVLRVMRANEAKAHELQAQRPASDALIEELD